ncbi:energy transducer TonB [Hymenobacter ruricola]|uniref:energy transducer TonB n=1 Tax=Hymenobacter ruricola TaxID=2791023 RepID=UPI0018B00BFB|nr:energy transducer TonB [Hymenobacter ruricola]
MEPGDSARTTSQRMTRFISKDFKYPRTALRDGVGGRVFFSFTVNAQGHTTDLKLVKGVRADIDAEALRCIQRLAAVTWQPGWQDGRPVSVSFTAPLTFSVSTGTKDAPSPWSADSLDLGPFQKLALPTQAWNSDRKALPAGKGLIYGSCLQRLGGTSSLGTGEYVRLVNVRTGKSVRLNVKPALNSRRENAFCYALPAGRYALYLYEFPDPVWGACRMHTESIRKPAPGRGYSSSLSSTRFQFVVEAGKLHYVGTWNLANENQPEILNEKSILDARMQPNFESLRFSDAQVAVPQ